MRISLCKSLILLTLIPVWVNAQITFEFQQGVRGYNGTFDTYFQSGRPEQSHGGKREWEWDGSDAGGINYGALYFAQIIGNESNQIPPNSHIIRAFLTFQISNAGNAAEIGTVHDLLKPFSEEQTLADFTENSEPFPGDDYAEEVVADIAGPSVGDLVEIDVTTSLQKWVSGTENYGWLFVPAPNSTNGVGIQSSEINETGVPRLVITTPDEIYTFKDGEHNYSGTVDTYINSGTSTVSFYGDQDWMEWDALENSGANYGLIKFEGIFGDSPNQIPYGTFIDKAQIFMTVQNAGNTAEFHEILSGISGEPTSFNETDTTMITFGNGREPREGTDYAEDVIEIIDGVNGLQEIDVTPTIQNYSDGEANRGWIIVPTGNNGVEVISSERAEEFEVGFPAKLTVIIEERETSIPDFSMY